MTMLVTAAQMRELDRRTIELGTPGLVLMERAGAGIAKVLLEQHRSACKRGVLVLAGRGNNGGDGFVVARLLAKRGCRCSVILLGARDALKGDARINADRWAKARGRVVEIEQLDDEGRALLEREIGKAGVVLDGLFGTGLSRPIDGLAAEVIVTLNAATRAQPAGGEASGALETRAAVKQAKRTGRKKPGRSSAHGVPLVVAIDVPSGLDADAGVPLGDAVRAAATVTLGGLKPGIVLPAARPYVGELTLVEIGLADEAFEAVGPFGETGDAAAAATLVPVRAAGAHKGTNGHLLIVAGSLGKSGAALLCARAALRGGAGLVTCACPEDALPMIASGLPELMTDPTARRFAAAAWLQRLEGKAALVVGPGLGADRETVDLVHWLVASAGKPMVIDADGLNAIASDPGVLHDAPHGVVLTPHPGEMARLTGLDTREVQKDRIGHARALATRTGAVVVLKGSGTVIAAPDGRWSVNASGGPILGTGGTGDVLAGLTGSLLAQGLAPYDAARLGVYLHGRAGDRIAERIGDAGLLASELADELPLARRELAS